MTNAPLASKLFTAAWVASLPADIVRIGISRGPPRGHPRGYRMYRRLAPGNWFRSLDVARFEQRYQSEILDPLDARQVVDDLLEIGQGQSVALLCFERTLMRDGPCHRALVAKWIKRETDLDVPEFGSEALGSDRHPMWPIASGSPILTG